MAVGKPKVTPPAAPPARSEPPVPVVEPPVPAAKIARQGDARDVKDVPQPTFPVNTNVDAIPTLKFLIPYVRFGHAGSHGQCVHGMNMQ